MTLLLFLFGLCVGSFLNVIIDRLPRGESVVKGRSYCERCHHPLVWSDLIPLLSFVLLKGHCRYCGRKISWQYPLVEFATGAVFALSTINNQQSTIPFILYSLFLIPVFVIDLKHGIIPDRLVYPAIGLVVGSRLLEGWGILGSRPLLWALLGSLVLYSFFFILHSLFKGRALGGGDVKLAFLVGLITGWPNMIVAVFSAFLTGAFVSVILILLHKKKFGGTVPFGPFLVVGTYTALFWGDKILGWYLGLLQMGLIITPARRHILSGLFVNLTATWFAAAALTPNFVSLEKPGNFLMLTYDIFGGIIFLGLAVLVEEGF